MKIPILLYHSINDDNSSMSLKINIFENQMKYLRKNGYKTVTFDEINKSAKKQIIITFDDGYKDVINNALPILKKNNFKAICFFVTNFIGKNNHWDIKKKNYFKKEIMNLNDIENWIELSEKNLFNELEYSKKYLEDKFNTKDSMFCYPFGRVNKNVYSLTRKIYSKAVTTNRSRYNIDNHDIHLIPRIDMGKNFSSFKI